MTKEDIFICIEGSKVFSEHLWPFRTEKCLESVAWNLHSSICGDDFIQRLNSDSE